MIWPLFFLIASSAFAQIDLSAVKELDASLPSYNETQDTDEEKQFHRQAAKFGPPKKIILVEEISQSGTQLGAVSPGSSLRNLKDNKDYVVTKLIYVKYFNYEDENGFKYIQNKDGSISWRILSQHVEPIKEELALYEPPLRYTPAPDNIIRADYDKKLSIPPELSFYAGIIQGDFMQDLFNDSEARSGISTQYGLHFFTQWKLPIKAGGVLHFEKSTYNLSSGEQIVYSAISAGPQFKTREFEIQGHPLRFQAQFRISPLARATADMGTGPITLRFNSADLLTSLERPVKNRFGEFVLGFFFQSQWLNLRDQTEPVSLRASNKTNKTFGLSLAQVFE